MLSPKKLNHKTCFLVMMPDVRPFLQQVFVHSLPMMICLCTRQSLAVSHATKLSLVGVTKNVGH